MYETRLNILGAFLVDKFRNELEAQGHVAKGELINSLRYEVKNTGAGYEINIYGLDYAKYVEMGFGAGHWVNPYALAEWVETKGIASGEREIKNAAFAIRNKIFKEGMPTRGSYQFSKNGRRKEFIQAVIKAESDYIAKEILGIFKEETAIKLLNVVRQNSGKF
jgi:hypothetical protein